MWISERAHAPAYKDIMQFFGVRIVKSTQIRRRARKWKRADVPARKTNVPSNLPSERDITSYAKTLAHCKEKRWEYRDIPSLKQGWARRPPWGKMYDARYIKRYEEEVAELFRQGEDNSSCKLGPARMLEVLIEKHPTKNDHERKYRPFIRVTTWMRLCDGNP
ncbi:hypothetical protein PC113_g15861 [Phytophthora cactorum]|uniref:Uncharacterized protein n=1 Tax=Phytophthora cactorum TaxID=29920 RepID=A0A8T0YQL3_9STRA|nr:hypothetical protein PC111_g14784 [Phytophthora cactorum]KAG2851492.1 hypothetical protein PC113_g15861 [Phytophthora cactorum]KAG2890601.1 hypothetical protein PC114_g17372 [Phytophthora cactorum]KAG2903538.1 hypothetical protein PC115_g15288 [Phytophthora cactorum]KAG3071266.1 hypothetical protein PC122_g15728 [Phytophthora cactorum]